MMMLAPVRLIAIRDLRISLGLSGQDQRRIRSHLRLEPLKGELLYPAMAVRRVYPDAGLYEEADEFRNSFGYPFLVARRWLFVDRYLPLFAVQLYALGSECKSLPLSPSEMDYVDLAAIKLVETYTSVE